ncbi:NAD(P)/FAD-dependent oxidoreductase [Nonomuraea sp. MCN248]|uniref:NAD(P)/FAD-dependent oxidoreductase n=1 Tax=Nonomuraea corallina TaxID=2989783 RepID=A0ABT4SBU0_9ACTN|nr:NAD(P)/FAD-dependent oxidoreductase [Nonomuraea corallina]MDA0634425.1 NAD(P)/FAD-dependent oxidoreductase [Nonomuraea corallina]
MEPTASPEAVIVGAGLAGPLLASLIARRGHRVDLVEGRPDPRATRHHGGRSINLGMSARAIAALREVGLWQEARRLSVPMRGRMVHTAGGRPSFHPYGKDPSQILHSISREALARLLVEHAEKQPGVRLRFDARCVAVDRDRARVTLADGDELAADFVVGADGASSIVRTEMQRGLPAAFSREYLEWGYKEITIHPLSDGTPAVPLEALHIWPGERGLGVAHPNIDNSLTCTLFLPRDEPPDPVSEAFPHLAELVPDLDEQADAAPMSHLTTVRTAPWHHRDKAVLVGDAAHAVYPFYGQGMNASFEDCLVLDGMLARHPHDREAAFAAYEHARKPHTDVLAELSARNFLELRDGMRSPVRLARKRLDLLLHKAFPGTWVPLYTLVSHTTVPYGEALRRARRQDRVAAALAATGAGLGVAGLLAALGRRHRRNPR